jgi:hypothetical protein
LSPAALVASGWEDHVDSGRRRCRHRTRYRRSIRDGEYQRRHGNREERIRERWGRLAGLVLALSGDPQSTQAWKRGSIGESKVAKTLARLDRDDIVVLHDRKVPGTRGNIDHLVICPAGVLVIDSKRYEGQVHTKDVGGLFARRDLRLLVGRRDCTSLAEAMGWQVAAVKAAIDRNPTPVRSHWRSETTALM